MVSAAGSKGGVKNSRLKPTKEGGYKMASVAGSKGGVKKPSPKPPKK